MSEKRHSEMREKARSAMAVLQVAENCVELASVECGRVNTRPAIRAIRAQQQKLLHIYDRAKADSE